MCVPPTEGREENCDLCAAYLNKLRRQKNRRKPKTSDIQTKTQQKFLLIKKIIDQQIPTLIYFTYPYLLTLTAILSYYPAKNKLF